MKSSLMIFASLVLAASQVSAQANTTKKATIKKAPASVAAPAVQPVAAANVSQAAQPESRLNRWVANRVSAGVIFSTASEISGVSINDGFESTSGNLSTSPAVGAQAQYNFPADRIFDLTAGLQIYSDRSIDSFSKGLAFKSRPGFQPYVMTAGLEFKTPTPVYIPVAANWTIANNTNSGDLKNFGMSPRLGLQVGAGAKFNRNGAIELMYQSLSYAVTADSSEGRIDSTVNFSGFTLSGKYVF